MGRRQLPRKIDGHAQWVPLVQIMGGLWFICANKVGPGHIHHLDYDKIQLGAYSAINRQRELITAMQAIADDFQRANIPINGTNDLSMARWRKLVWNVPYNGLSVVLDATTKMKPYRTSMKIDFDQGRPLEVDAILANPIRAAAELGVAVPTMEKLYGQLKALST